jgi:hypothetical protein
VFGSLPKHTVKVRGLGAAVGIITGSSEGVLVASIRDDANPQAVMTMRKNNPINPTGFFMDGMAISFFEKSIF